MVTDNLHMVGDLAIRVRELTLLHEVTRIVQRDHADATDWLEEITWVIQRLWPYPVTIDVRSRLGTFEVATAKLGKLAPACHVEFTVTDGRTGSIDLMSLDGAGNHAPSVVLLEEVTEIIRTEINRRLELAGVRESEQRYRGVVEQQSDLVCRYFPDTTLTFVNDAYCRYFEKSRQELIGRPFIDLIPEPGRAAALKHVEALVRGGETRVYEHNVLRSDGSLGRQQWIDHAIRSPQGQIEELQGIGRDVTDRWRAEEALRQKETTLREAYERIRSLAHRLMLAQETERTEIARDLHDDVSQQLAALGIGLSLVEAQLANGDRVREEVARLRHLSSEVAEKVRHVSHALHPGVLQHAGLNAAIASHCEAVAGQHEFLVRFEARGTFTDVPDDVALCLYRAAQQALRNVAMHAQASRAWVSLVRVGNRIELSISDNGRGFDVSTPRVQGLGLMSIEERVHLANGTFSVTSRPGGGSRLSISVPVGWPSPTHRA
jgi:PAS domain S-box-containing protein